MQQSVSQSVSHLREDTPENVFFWDERIKIGQGGYATVYKVRRREDNKVWAAKLVTFERMRCDKHWRQLVHEIEILRRLNHPSCIQMCDAFRTPTHACIVLELVNGGELFEVIMKRGKFKEREAAEMTKQIIEALDYLHRKKGIVHRDLKPENILVDSTTNAIKIIDFGFAKFIGKVTDGGKTPGGGLLGAPPTLDAVQAALPPGADMPATTPILDTPKGSVRYMAPEILSSLLSNGVRPRVTTREQIARLDMFAVGVILFVMLGGKFPFKCRQGERPIDQSRMLLPQICEGVGFENECWGAVSEDAKDFCRQMLNPIADQRLNTESALQHPWLKDTSNSPITEIKIQEQEVKSMSKMYDEIRSEENKKGKEVEPPIFFPGCGFPGHDPDAPESGSTVQDAGQVPEPSPQAQESDFVFKPKKKKVQPK